MIRVGVVGAGGRMGRTVCAAVAGDPRFELVAAVDPSFDGVAVAELVPGISSDVVVGSMLSTLVDAHVDAVVDFTSAQSAINNLGFCARIDVHAVCGTTGIDAASIDTLAEAFATSAANCVLAPNFALSAVLMMRFCELAAPYFDGVEVIELHHNQKKDAPSGTAIETVRRMLAARGDIPFAADPTTDLTIEGARGADQGGVHVHSVRLPGLVAHQEVLFGSAGQTLRLHQDSFDRSSFMPGVLLALSKVDTLSGLTIGLDALLDL